ncbi:MAG TPA: hypothetical protein VGB91_09695 [Rhizomicrobium sp.]
MNKSRFLALSFLLAATSVGSAYAQAPALAAGTYKLTVGSKTPCDVTITSDGALTPASTCETAMPLAKWTQIGPTGYQLVSTSGETYAVIKPHGEQLEGTTFADQRKVVLSH